MDLRPTVKLAKRDDPVLSYHGLLEEGRMTRRDAEPRVGEQATFFAAAERAGPEELAAAVALASQNPIVDAVMRSWGGLVAVLNPERQVVAVNDALLRHLGVEDAREALGLRPGEALGCVHAGAAPSGCGTGRTCSTCGAAIAIVAALTEGCPEDRDCALAAARNGDRVEVLFRVRASPLEVGGTRLVLLFLRDVTAERRRAALERAFFHDINNVVMSLRWAGEELAEALPDAALAGQVREAASRLADEVAMQRATIRAETGALAPRPTEVSVAELLASVASLARAHPAAAGKGIVLRGGEGAGSVLVDRTILLRIVTNMVVNALEATVEGREIRVSFERREGAALFSVWNAGAIPEAVRPRVFQRYFSTKVGDDRGIGTSAMRLLGEKILGGRVSFTTSEEEGTTFTVRLPESRPG